MIKFKTVKNTEGKIISFTVEGHSGFAESGEDIVCASVSSAVWMTVNGIEAQKLAKINYINKEAFVSCSISEERQKGCDALLISLELFITELSAQYKENIRITQG